MFSLLTLCQTHKIRYWQHHGERASLVFERMCFWRVGAGLCCLPRCICYHTTKRRLLLHNTLLPQLVGGPVVWPRAFCTSTHVIHVVGPKEWVLRVARACDAVGGAVGQSVCVRHTQPWIKLAAISSSTRASYSYHSIIKRLTLYPSNRHE